MSNANGVVNPSGFYMGLFAPVYLLGVPLTSYIGNNAVVQRLTEGLVSIIPGNIPQSRVIPALGAWYIFVTFGASAALSVAGQAASRKQGLDNSHPRAHVNNLTGLPLRLRSAHLALMEIFPGFALAAALAYSTSPTSQKLQNLLGLHVMLKTLVFWPAYVFDVNAARSFSHLFSVAALINVAWSVATGGL